MGFDLGEWTAQLSSRTRAVPPKNATHRTRRNPRHGRLTLGAGVAVASSPNGLSPGRQRALTVGVLAVVLDALPVTALLIPVVPTVLEAARSPPGALLGFTDPVVFLLSGFVHAAALLRHGSNPRFALAVSASIGTSPRWQPRSRPSPAVPGLSTRRG